MPQSIIASRTGGHLAIIGAVALRTSGVYFIMITLAFAQMVYYIAIALDRAWLRWTPQSGTRVDAGRMEVPFERTADEAVEDSLQGLIERRIRPFRREHGGDDSSVETAKISKIARVGPLH